AIYDALVRMAQPFSLRHPLIDFHGNYGSPDFEPAAERYTECRLAQLAMQMILDIDEDTVDFVDNYSGEFTEPGVLPSRFPNLLVNGSQGIAVGMATNIPPHNLGEVVDATLHLIDHPEATPDDLMQFVKGPDFPTGGSILGRAGIMDAYRTGRGSIKMRAKAAIEEGKRGQMQIVVTELPYQTSCASIAGRIQELVDAGDLEGIADVNDQLIALIRASDDAAAAKVGLMAEPYEFSEVQAQDILEMRLAQLTRLSRIDIEREVLEVRASIVELEAILADPAVLNEVIRS